MERRERTDEDIKRDIVEHLYWDGRVDASKVEVRVDAGRVRLTGSLPSHLARRAALADAWDVAGVEQVEDALSVLYPGGGGAVTDERLRENVLTALGWSPDLQAAHFDARVDGGRVTITGSVDAFWKKALAEEIVKGLRGVLDVENHLAVAPGRDVMDQGMAEAIEAALERNALVDASRVTVEAHDGIVTLSGSVDSPAAAKMAYLAATYTPGVLDVRNRLVVARQGLPYHGRSGQA